jgi:hypothetical protein
MTSESMREGPAWECSKCGAPTGVLILDQNCPQSGYRLCVSCADVADLAATTPEPGDTPLIRLRRKGGVFSPALMEGPPR